MPKNLSAAQSGAVAKPRSARKSDNVIALLSRANGATLDDLVQATGWQPHTARAALTGLKKKGHTIERTKAEGVSRYRIASAVSK